MNGWQEFYEPRPNIWQWLIYHLICRFIGHRWAKEEKHASGSPCKRCGFNSVQMN
jgi:hypothetical protein